MQGLNLILLAGLPATGKSHFSAMLASKLSLPVLEKDLYKEILFDDIGFKSREEKVALGNAAMDLMYHEAETLLKLGISVVLDNNFENSSLPGLHKLMGMEGVHTVTVRFEGDVNTIYRRFVARDQNPRRHRGHVVNTCYPEGAVRQAYVPIGVEAFEKKFRERGVMDFYPGGKLIRANVTAKDYSEERLFEQLKKELA